MTETAPAFSPDPDVIYIPAEQRSHLTDFWKECQRAPLAGLPWEFGAAHTTNHGWLVAWRVGPKALVHQAAWARQFVRAARADGAELQRKGGTDVDFPAYFDMLDRWEAKAKEVLDLNRRGAVPATYPQEHIFQRRPGTVIH